MILKEAYRYQKFLSDLIQKSVAKLLDNDFIMTRTETHNRKKANSDAQDEVITVKPYMPVEYTPNDIIDFIVKLVDEKQKISNAIVEAKRNTEIDIDSSIAMNKVKQSCANAFKIMAGKKSKEEETTGTDYKFDVNGEQKSYRYPMTVVTTINYDRDDVKKLAKKYLSECDSVSTTLDNIQITTIIDFEPQFDINSSFDELVLGE